MNFTEEEIRFMGYWESNRTRKKRLVWQLAAGLPLAAVMVLSILINVFSGWFKGATSVLKVNSTSVLVILAAIIGIVVFIVYFSSRHQWEMNEQRYQELRARKK